MFCYKQANSQKTKIDDRQF